MESSANQEEIDIDHLCTLRTVLLLELFPENYEIEKDTLVQLFLATGLHKEESVSVACINVLEEAGHISRSRKDCEEQTGKLWYRVKLQKVSKTDLDVGDPADNYTFSCGDRRKIVSYAHLRVDFDDPNDGRLFSAPDTLQHITVQNLPAKCVQQLERFDHLETLWFLNSHKSHIHQVPYQFFISLKLLRVLNLSRTKISELPNSIRYVTRLCYLDLSHSLVKNVPGSVGYLQDLKTLKLQNCRDLLTLPKNTFNLTKLEHLDLGALCTLHCMPPKIGELTCLRTLSAFLVGDQPGCGISEVRNLNYLQGEICLSRLENVADPAEGSAANLNEKSLLKSLTLQWSQRNRIKINTQIADEVIQSLRPNTNLKYLQVLGFHGKTFPTWINDPSFENLVSVNLSLSETCEVLPHLGRLPSLRFLTLDGLTGIRVIDYNFCRETAGNNAVAFPKLENLGLVSLFSLEEWKDVSRNDFPSLIKLEIKGCPKLVSVCSVSDMLCLKHLEISKCPLLSSLPAEGPLSNSVEEVVIEECPLLESRCSPDGEDWHKIKHVGSVWIDYEEVSI